MLSIEHQQVINGITVYRDFQNPNQYYYLPPNTIKIGENGKRLQYVVYIDGEVQQGVEPDFTQDMDRVGGFLTLEVELGPTASEITLLKSALESEVGSSVQLSQVPFKDGSVKLVMFGQDGSDNSTADFSIAGTTKPSLYGTNNAVFSVRLGGLHAQILYNLLFKNTGTQVAAVYELDYLGVMPAYHLEITVDFKATEEYWNHQFDIDASVEFGAENNRSKVAASADIDLLIRDLVNEGSIKIKEIVYAEGGQSTNLLGDDPTAIKLVKQLLGPELFSPTAIPREDYRAIQEAISSSNNNSSSSTNNSSTNSSGTSSTNSSSSSAISSSSSTAPGGGVPPGFDRSEEDELESDTFDPNDLEGIIPNPNLRASPPGGGGGDPRPIISSSSTSSSSSSNLPSSSSSLSSSSSDGPAPIPSSSSGNTQIVSSNSSQSISSTSSSSTSGNSGESSSPGSVQDPKLNVNIGYTLKRRSISEQIKRTYTFDRAEAKTHKIYPQGIVTTQGTAFDPEKQLQLVRLGDGPFKNIELDVRSSVNLEEYRIQELIVHIDYGYKGREGDKTNRLHHISLNLNRNESRKVVNFFVDQYGTLEFDYYVEFIHEPNTIIGTRETKITSRKFEDVTERSISVNIRDHSPLIPVEVQPGYLEFNPDRIQSVQVYLAPDSTGNGKTSIFNAQHSELRKWLILPGEENQDAYYAKESFFFQSEEFQIEHEEISDGQLVINSPATRILNITPTLADSVNIVRQVLVDIIYTNGAGEEKTGTVNLTPQETSRTYAIRKEVEDPIIWQGKSRFVLNNGKILDGKWITYNISSPFITLAASGFRAIKVFTLLRDNTFSGTIAAIEVYIFDRENEENTKTNDILMPGQIEAVLLIENVLPSQALIAQIKIYRTNGNIQDREFVVSAGNSNLLLPITDINA